MNVAAFAVLVIALTLGSCSGGTASIPPCNALIYLWGNADLRLDCPATEAIPLWERKPVK